MTTPARLSPCSPEPKSGPRWSDDADLAALQRTMRGDWKDPGSTAGFTWDAAIPFPLDLLILILLLLTLPLWVLFALPFRARRRVDLRRQLAEIPPERLTAVLRMLHEEPPSSGRRMAEAILREMAIPTEVSPASPPFDPAKCNNLIVPLEE
jgi:hypothetical protein